MRSKLDASHHRWGANAKPWIARRRGARGAPGQLPEPVRGWRVPAAHYVKEQTGGNLGLQPGWGPELGWGRKQQLKTQQPEKLP